MQISHVFFMFIFVISLYRLYNIRYYSKEDLRRKISYENTHLPLFHVLHLILSCMKRTTKSKIYKDTWLHYHQCYYRPYSNSFHTDMIQFRCLKNAQRYCLCNIFIIILKEEKQNFIVLYR